MAIGKDDGHAIQHWGEIYNAIPKSVWATVAWHLANVASGECDNHGAAESRVIVELCALASNGILPDMQSTRAVKAILKAGFTVKESE